MFTNSMVRKYAVVLCISLSIGLLFGSIVAAKIQSENTFVSSLDQPLQKIESNIFELSITKSINNEIISLYPSSNTCLSASSKTVHVKSYHRKDGTYVRSHYRRAPK